MSEASEHTVWKGGCEIRDDYYRDKTDEELDIILSNLYNKVVGVLLASRKSKSNK